MPEIALQFVAERRLGSWAIGWFSAGHLSHVDAVFPTSLFGARWDNAGDRPSGVWSRPPGYARFTRRVRMSLPATLAQRERWSAFLRRQRGLAYDWQAILGFALERDWRAPDSWICSELQAAALEEAEILPPLYLAANKITPVALALVVSALPGVRIEELAP